MKEISTKELQNLIEANNELNIIDVREVDEVATGKIKGAVNIPLGLLEFRKQELNKSEEYIMVCRSGGRSGQATKYLESQGFNVTNMTGGMLSWEGEVE
ncbi:rhodanese-like domain-containing protein [Gracilibacillus kekensis]|uniref:Rhodanese-related sulfurtransferase n=1 Tax=Gracilibacillus kekensis TaxID=1027249 RepID=A0A1M7KI93_9BACI|nr:rhodanese-like domain-containing protein [Gracilibacillus kekensis]SHM65116.1 Rhodanese-related sulfurtransferase [Gracilibacillus kekensis]